jgi:hypothetical protein
VSRCRSPKPPLPAAPPQRPPFTDTSALEPKTDRFHENSRYADHVGIHYVLCSKLRQFAYEELEFFLPQYVAAHPLGRQT